MSDSDTRPAEPANAGELRDTVAAVPAVLTLPPMLDRFELLEVLGRGGMGVVHRARDSRLNRIVALKFSTTSGEGADLARFLAEAEAIATVDHPNVVRVYESGEHDGRPFLAMEFLPGGSLASRLQVEHRLAPRTAAALIAKVSAGVQAAHDQGIIHRDLKPGNVLLDSAGEPKVADFGLAKRGNLALTRTDAVIGTPAYMSPEQASGRTKFAGPAADVYALGVMLYECLTGTVPFQGEDVWSVIRQVAENEPESASKRFPGVPSDLNLVCQKCLAKDPRDRYPTAAHLVADLQRYLNGEAVAVRQAGRLERALRWARRNPLRAAVCALAAFALISGGFGTITAVLWQRAESARNSLAEEKRETDRLKDQLEEQTYIGSLDLAADQLRAGRPSDAASALDAAPIPRRGWEWQLMRSSIAQEAVGFTSDGGPPGAIAWRPDGTQIATAGEDGIVRLWRSVDGGLIARQKLGGRLYTIAYSADGTRIAAAGESGLVHILDAQTLSNVIALRPEAQDRLPEALLVAFHPSRARVAAGYENGAVRLWDTNSGTVVRDFPPHEKGCGSVAFNREGRLATGDYSGTLRIWDAESGTKLAETTGESIASIAAGSPGWAVLRDDGTLEYTAWTEVGLEASLFGATRIWDALSRVRHRIALGSREPREVTLSPDGRWAAVALSTGGVFLLDSLTGGTTTWKAHPTAVATLAFSPDGASLATAGEDGVTRIWTHRAPPFDTLRLNEHLTAAAFRTGNHVLTLADRGGRVFDLDLRSGVGRTLGLLPVTPVPAAAARDLQPDEVRLVTLGVRGLTVAGPVVAAAANGTLVSPVGAANFGWPANAKPELTPSRTGGSKFHGAEFESPGEISAIASAADGSWIAAGRADGVIGRWRGTDPAALGEVLSGHNGPIGALAASPDGRWIASGGFDGTVRYRMPGTDRVRVFGGHIGEVISVAVSPDGRFIVSGGADRTIRIWSAAEEHEPRVFAGHLGPVSAVAFNRDGLRIVSGSMDGTARIWDLASGKPLVSLVDGEVGAVRSLAVSPDGDTLAVAGSRGLRVFTRNLPAVPLLQRLPAPDGSRSKLSLRRTG